MPNKPKIHSRSPVASTRLFNIEQVELEFSNGAKRTYECLKSKGIGAVTILAVDKGDILLVREYGCALDEYCLGLPKGALSNGECPLTAADRELKEEVGLGANHIEQMTQLYSSPSYSGNPLYFIYATDCYSQKLPGDEPEELEVVRWPASDWQGLLSHPSVKDIGTNLAVLMWAQKYAR